MKTNFGNSLDFYYMCNLLEIEFYKAYHGEIFFWESCVSTKQILSIIEKYQILDGVTFHHLNENFFSLFSQIEQERLKAERQGFKYENAEDNVPVELKAEIVKSHFEIRESLKKVEKWPLNISSINDFSLLNFKESKFSKFYFSENENVFNFEVDFVFVYDKEQEVCKFDNVYVTLKNWIWLETDLSANDVVKTMFSCEIDSEKKTVTLKGKNKFGKMVEFRLVDPEIKCILNQSAEDKNV